jgi:pyruvate/oxaloacetate carboxyltransferase
MAISGFRRFMPTFLPLAFEIFRHFKRDLNHNGNIRKADKSTEKLATMEHMLVRLEKKIQHNRETYEKIAGRVYFWLLINSAMLIAILVKLFFY